MDNQYSREYQAYLTYALQRYLTEHCNYTEKDAEIKVMQDFEEVEQEAREAGFLWEQYLLATIRSIQPMWFWK